MQKYYSFSSEVASQVDNTDMMMQMAEKQVNVAERTNPTSDGSDSIFILDPLLTLVSA